MRVLCLHPAASSAIQLSQEFTKLEERLWSKYGVELVFIDGPLLDVQIGNAVGCDGGGINAIGNMPSTNNDGSGGDSNEQQHVSRRWYVEEETKRAALPSPTSTTDAPPTTSPQVQYSGLDASLLHLTQIWSRGGANISNNLGECLPFQGILGVGQGANVAGLLPLLNYQHDDEEEDENEGDCDTANESGMDSSSKPTMFQGLQFVISIDGRDILHKRDDDNVEGEENDEVYVGPDGVQSLHIINTSDNTDDTKRKSSERLANQYGPNATIHHYKQSTTSNSITITPSLCNIIGKFLVSQKNKLHSNPQSRELMTLQTQLANVEQLATLTIAQEIQRNPPKALMAVIGPTAMMTSNNENDDGGAGDDEVTEDKDVNEKQHCKEDGVKVVDKAVGAWNGARRRGFGEEGGGAPCPEEFLLREEER